MSLGDILSVESVLLKRCRSINSQVKHDDTTATGPRANEDMTKLGGAESRITMSRSRKVSRANWGSLLRRRRGGFIRAFAEPTMVRNCNVRRRELQTPQESIRDCRMPMPRNCSFCSEIVSFPIFPHKDDLLRHGLLGYLCGHHRGRRKEGWEQYCLLSVSTFSGECGNWEGERE